MAQVLFFFFSKTIHANLPQGLLFMSPVCLVIQLFARFPTSVAIQATECHAPTETPEALISLSLDLRTMPPLCILLSYWFEFWADASLDVVARFVVPMLWIKKYSMAGGVTNMHPTPQVPVIFPYSVSHKRLLWWFLASIRARTEDCDESLILEMTNQEVLK